MPYHQHPQQGAGEDRGQQRIGRPGRLGGGDGLRYDGVECACRLGVGDGLCCSVECVDSEFETVCDMIDLQYVLIQKAN